VQQRMRPYSQRLNSHETEAQVERGYWVYLPPSDSQESAIEITRQLSAMGMEDYFVVNSGEDVNAVSLGVFNEQRNANTRQEQLRSLGYDAKIQVFRETQPQYWIDYQLLPDAESPWRYVLQMFTGTRRLSIHCGQENPAANEVVALNDEGGVQLIDENESIINTEESEQADSFTGELSAQLDADIDSSAAVQNQ